MYLSDISFPWFRLEEEFDDKKGVIKICKSEDRQYNGQMQEEKTTFTIFKTLHKNLKIEQHEPH